MAILNQERGYGSYLTSRSRSAGGIAGFEGERIRSPKPVVYFRPGQAVCIFFNSRRQSLRKLSTVTRSFALDGSAPNWRYRCGQGRHSELWSEKVR